MYSISCYCCIIIYQALAMSIKCCFFINNNDFKFQCEQNEVCELKKSNNKLKILKEETKTI